MIKGDNMVKYEALLFSPDGDWLIDFEEDTIDKVKQDLNDMGSSWHFYPYAFIIKVPKKEISEYLMKEKIIDVGSEEIKSMKGLMVERAIKKIVDMNRKKKSNNILK